MNQILIVSFSGSNRKILSEFCVHEKELLIDFSEYVKSQLHVNIVTDLKGRNITDYLNVYKFLNNEMFYTHSMLVVLRYFYDDIANFLINNPANVKVTLKINNPILDGLSEIAGMGTLDRVYEMDESQKVRKVTNVTGFTGFNTIREFLQKLINCSDFEKLGRVIEESKYAFIVDRISSLDDLEQKMDSYVMAAAIIYFLNNEFSEVNLKDFDLGC